MKKKDSWILFLEENPQFNEVVKSALFISILRHLREGSLSYDKLRVEFPRIEKMDMELILGSLIKLELVSKVSLQKNVLFAVTDLGVKLLENYEDVSGEYNTE